MFRETSLGLNSPILSFLLHGCFSNPFSSLLIVINILYLNSFHTATLHYRLCWCSVLIFFMFTHSLMNIVYLNVSILKWRSSKVFEVVQTRSERIFHNSILLLRQPSSVLRSLAYSTIKQTCKYLYWDCQCVMRVCCQAPATDPV